MRKKMKDYTLPLNDYGNVNGIPDGWTATKKRIDSLKALGIPVYKACTGFEKNGHYVKPVIVNIIPKEFEEKAVVKKSKPKSEEQKVAEWCRRLDKLTGCGVEEANRIAWEKLAYRDREVIELENRQVERYSSERAKLVRKIISENPLRRITGKDHAEAILKASERHRDTDYEKRLKETSELAHEGLIDFDEAYELARTCRNVGEVFEAVERR